MNVLTRLKRLESENPNKPPCFCGKTWIDLCFGIKDTDVLTHCPNCKSQYDFWANLACDAQTSKNLTDGEAL